MLLLVYSQVSAADIRNIQLTDGSVITGEIILYSNGVYTIKTDSLGALKINNARVRSITSTSSQPGTAAGGGNSSLYNPKYDPQVKSVQQQMLDDPALLQLITALQADPEFSKTLQDPEILQAIISGDTDRLASNPKIRQLLNNPTALEIYKRVK